jgi:hypothetical protein
MPKTQLIWKRQLKNIHDNPNYIEENIKAIQHELKNNQPSTAYLRQKVNNIELWISEIELAAQRAKMKRLSKVS